MVCLSKYDLDDDEEADDAFEERAGILEYEAGLTRAEAERQAAADIKLKGD